MQTLVVYNRQQVREWLRTWTTQQLLTELNGCRQTGTLTAEQHAELVVLGQAWMQRALGPLPLRDALLVDPRRGARVYDLLCTILTREYCPLPPEAASLLEPSACGELTPQQMRAWLDAVIAANPQDAEHLADLIALLRRAEAEGLALACLADDARHYPFPDDLETLLPPVPSTFPQQHLHFEQPIGRRRRLAIGLAFLGVALLGLPLVMGYMPTQPAGLPLALLTLALLVGIRAGWAGYSGSLCIWLVANLPGFHHDTVATTLWPGVPMLVLGVILLALDRHVRIMWCWLWQRLSIWG
jgi:hypothetical protein